MAGRRKTDLHDGSDPEVQWTPTDDHPGSTGSFEDDLIERMDGPKDELVRCLSVLTPAELAAVRMRVNGETHLTSPQRMALTRARKKLAAQMLQMGLRNTYI